MSDDSFGFSDTRKARLQKIAAFNPRKDLGTEALEQVDKAGDALGFVPREIPAKAPTRRRKEIGPTVAINMRVPEAIADVFINYCEQNRLSYWEGVADLMQKAGVST
ncbi:hypothetical protein [Acetobacter thailandicus]|uniref:hypothetical protein n=1 Tax=Acetobacter thailandicus TaxID=1502842 RepID=UPI001BA85B01|nr:hypothetical protein [Acetobacter thailandicus]MBS0981465.1 hypothetical protein [Acetobacter thailandicus]